MAFFDFLSTPAAAAPPGAVGSLLIFGVQLETWVLIGTAIYTVLALFALVRDKYWKHYREKTDDDPS